jgi:hypothetical protein
MAISNLSREIFIAALSFLIGAFLVYMFTLRVGPRAVSKEDAETIVKRVRAVEQILGRLVEGALRPDEFVILLLGPGEPSKADSPDELHVRVWNLRNRLSAKLEGVAVTLTIENSTKALALRAGTIVILACSIGSATELGMISEHQSLCLKSVIAVHRQQKGAFMLRAASGAAKAFGAEFVDYGDDELERDLDERLFERILEKYHATVSRALQESLQRGEAKFAKF